MGARRTGRVTWRDVAGLLALASMTGCAALPPNSFIDPTKVGRFSLEASESGIRRVLTARDTPAGIPGATEPTPDDLVAEFTDYRLAPGDGINININDLVNAGVPYAANLEVNPLGEVRIPEIGSVRIAGLTEKEVEQEIKARLIQTGLLPDPVVVVFTQLRRGRTFTIVGGVGQAGQYPIVQPDLRVLDVIGLAGDVAATSKDMFVIRRVSQSSPSMAAPTPTPEPAVKEELVIPPPVAPSAPATFSSAAGTGRGADSATTAPALQELEELVVPATPAATPAQPAAAQPTGVPTATAAPEGTPPATARSQFEPLIIFDPETGAVREAAPPGTETPAQPTSIPVRLPEQKLDQPFNWEDVDELALEQRVIKLSVRDLKNGDPRQNIIVRDRDVINVPIDTGVFYVMGEINRPGVYGFGGRDITVKQALAIAGGFSPLAWPQRCEVVRREPGTDKQLTIPVNLDAIFYGLEDDFYLRDDDILNVGTHIAAPFLFVIRNSFRFTYGFGFVYDRNFADQDAVAGKQNPETLQQARRASLGLGF